jgi:hypothetical protein
MHLMIAATPFFAFPSFETLAALAPQNEVVGLRFWSSERLERLPLLELDIGDPDDFGVARDVVGDCTAEFRR